MVSRIQPKGAETDASITTPNLTLISCDLDLWPTDPKVDRSCSCHTNHLRQFASESACSFSNYHVHKCGNGRTDGQKTLCGPLV